MKSVLALYSQLKRKYPHIDHKWWPISGSFMPPQLEIVIGAVLTQNTNWENAEKSLSNLIADRKIIAEEIADCAELEGLIRPSGFYTQKSETIRDLCYMISRFDGDFYGKVTRAQLLKVKGIGKETADAILLYACDRPVFVVDKYTTRLLKREKMTRSGDYDRIQQMFHEKLPPDAGLYKEFHALIVENEKHAAEKLVKTHKKPAKRNA